MTGEEQHRREHRATRARRFAVLFVCVLSMAGLALRSWNATSAYHHDDEKHYAGDGAWVGSLDPGLWLGFLRDHPHPHPHLTADSQATGLWGEKGTIPHLGHPALHALILGPVFHFSGASTPRDRILVARRTNAVLDTAVVPLTAIAALGLGLSLPFAVLAAALYAVLPLIVTFGSLAYPDPVLALGVALLVVFSAGASRRHACAAGATAGLMAAAKATGLFLPAYAAALLLIRSRKVANAVLALVVSAVVAGTVVNPLRYGQELVAPLDPATAVRPDIVRNVRENVLYLTDYPRYYWLGFGQHGRPLALPMARANRLVTPVVHALVVLAALATLAARRWLLAFTCIAPLAVLLAFVPASNGMWRLHLAGPLACLLIASALGFGTRRFRALCLAVGLVVLAIPLLPVRTGDDGAVPLSEVLFANSSNGQSWNLFNALKGRPFRVDLAPKRRLTRRLWLAPGSYRVQARSNGQTSVTIDGQTVVLAAADSEPLRLDGYVHLLELTAPKWVQLYRLGIRRTDPLPSSPDR